MSQKYYDIIIIGSGIAGLYAAYNIQKMSPSTSFIILEKYKKTWIGGRTSNDTFYGTEVVTGAGIGRKNKDFCSTVCLLDELKSPNAFGFFFLNILRRGFLLSRTNQTIAL